MTTAREFGGPDGLVHVSLAASPKILLWPQHLSLKMFVCFMVGCRCGVIEDA